MYGFADKATAEEKCAMLSRRFPEHKYQVAAHSWTVTGAALTWGVLCHVPYCEAMSYKLQGFVWFPRNFSTLSPR